MAAKSGAGASVSSGADYQARIGAYLLATSICCAPSAIAGERKIAALGFETTEKIDDINVSLSDGAAIYIQAKANIQYSLAADSQLRSVLDQFQQQHQTRPNDADQYHLVTTGKSSRKITYDMRAALEAFRLGPEQRFRKDQPAALVQLIDELLAAVQELQAQSGGTPNSEAPRAILRKTFVFVLDVDSGAALEQGVLLVLQSCQFAAPSALWGKLIADCLAHAKARHTVDIGGALTRYEYFRVKAETVTEQATDELLRVEFGNFSFAVGREVVLARFIDTPPDNYPPLAIMEFYRFDENCNERIKFAEDGLVLGNGRKLSLLRRAATQIGLLRMIEANPELVGDEELAIWPINSDEDFEAGLCAETHRARLKQAALENPHLLHCIHCAMPVSSSTAAMVEAMRDNKLVVGLSHDRCLAPDDRVLGTVRSEFFDRHPELVNFDLNAWYRASHGGQIAFANADLARSSQPVIAWGGRRLRGPAGPFVVEMLLQGDGREFVTSRNAIDRLSKADAEDFVARVQEAIDKDRATDPLCYTDQSKAFGPRSTLIEQFGGKERLLVIERARVRPYDERFAARYVRPGHWYAPLAYLREISSGEAFSIIGSVVLLRAPLSLANYLANWREAGIQIPDYEVVSLLSDREFDDFMLRLEDKGLSAIVDPMVASDKSTRFASGLPIRSMESIEANAQRTR